jgi:hypothetical protein
LNRAAGIDKINDTALMRGTLPILLLVLLACDHRALAPTDGGTEVDAGPTFEKRVLRACAVVTACAPDSAPLAFRDPAQCVAALAGRGLEHPVSEWSSPSDRRVTDRLLRCAAEHRADCQRFHACYGTWGGLGICHIYADCRGTRIVAEAAAALYFDCASLGGTCVENAPRIACCKTKACKLTPCQGNLALSCSNGLYSEYECQPEGALCVNYDVCVGNGDHCEPGTKLQCLDPTKVRYCLNNRYHTYDCSQHPFFKKCGASDGLTCMGTDFSEVRLPASRCQGDDLVLELYGYRGTVSCTALGFGGCLEVAKGEARCRP